MKVKKTAQIRADMKNQKVCSMQQNLRPLNKTRNQEMKIAAILNITIWEIDEFFPAFSMRHAQIVISDHHHHHLSSSLWFENQTLAKATV